MSKTTLAALLIFVAAVTGGAAHYLQGQPFDVGAFVQAAIALLAAFGLWKAADAPKS